MISRTENTTYLLVSAPAWCSLHTLGCFVLKQCKHKSIMPYIKEATMGTLRQAGGTLAAVLYIVSMDKILHFTNTFIIIIISTSPANHHTWNSVSKFDRKSVEHSRVKILHFEVFNLVSSTFGAKHGLRRLALMLHRETRSSTWTVTQ